MTTHRERRLFIGLALPEGIRDEVRRCAVGLRNFGVEADNWTASDLYHITVEFLGSTSGTEEDALRVGLREVAGMIVPFSLTLSGVGGFKRSKVLWIGIEEDKGKQALTKLRISVRSELARMAPSIHARLDDRPFSPHVTVARKVNMRSFTPTASTGDTVALPHSLDKTSFRVHDLCLFESTRIDGRLYYPVLDRFPLMPE